jgi:hypothetical protein
MADSHPSGRNAIDASTFDGLLGCPVLSVNLMEKGGTAGLSTRWLRLSLRELHAAQFG